MKCKTCDNGLRPEEEEAEQCLYCADEERDTEWINSQIDNGDKHCDTCTCDEVDEYKPKRCPCCRAQVFCLECATEV